MIQNNINHLFGVDGFIKNIYDANYNSDLEFDEDMLLKKILDEKSDTVYYLYDPSGIRDEIKHNGSKFIKSPLKYSSLQDVVAGGRFDLLWIDLSSSLEDINEDFKTPTVISYGHNQPSADYKIVEGICGNKFALVNIDIDIAGGSLLIQRDDESIVDAIFDELEKNDRNLYLPL